jgi:uncharacterized YceG family protein
VTPGPPPVPGGRSPEEREAARREREARRAVRAGKPPPAAPPAEQDWMAEAQLLTDGDGAGRAPTVEAPVVTDDLPAYEEPPARNGGGRPRRPAPPRRRHPGRIVALLVLAAVVAGIAWFANSLFQPFKGDGQGHVRVVIPQGASLGEIGDLLEEKGVVSSSSFFQLRTRIAGRSGNLKPGSYDLQLDMRYMDVLDELERGLPPNVVSVGIPEGLSRREIAPLVRGKLPGNYVRASRRSRVLNPRHFKAPRGASLEGFLFPATYELKKGVPVKRLVNKQLETFKEKFDGVDLRYARRKNLTPYDVLIIASLVEREVAVPKERRLVASVIYNRLHQDIRLDIDATVRFVTGNWKRPLRVSELQNPSPYNTRVHNGLPPGPIGNPGLASIRAAAHPAKTDYLFYVLKPGTCNEHAFSVTDAEFQRDVDAYNRARDKLGGKSPIKC